MGRASATVFAAAVALGSAAALAQFADGFESPELTLCERIAADPDVMPEGFEGVIRSWGGAGGLFGPGTQYPDTRASEVYPVGSWTLGNSTYSGSQTTRGRWLSVPIVGDGTSYKFEWIQARPSSLYRYQPSRPTDYHYVTLSPCPGDFRRTTRYIPADPADASLVQQCRNHVIAETGLYYGPTGFGRCIVADGQEMWLNIIWVDSSNPYAPLDPSSTGCRDTTGGFCDTSWKHLPDGN